jgi:deazaflavin-dependent oxidoreductase (nitroreductase family)
MDSVTPGVPLKPRPDQLESPVVARLLKAAARAQVWIFQRTGGRIGSTWRIGAGWRKPVPTLLLDHVGRRSGTRFTTPLLYLLDGPDVVVVASQGGLPDHPQWYLNLLASPRTTVQIGREVRPVIARTANPAERAALWPRLVDMYADFASYQSWTTREIPVVICSPGE